MELLRSGAGSGRKKVPVRIRVEKKRTHAVLYSTAVTLVIHRLTDNRQVHVIYYSALIIKVFSKLPLILVILSRDSVIKFCSKFMTFDNIAVQRYNRYRLSKI